jgi:NAD(P)-dependent dehydrogenase (short-subunit alcohol dehydrogenase family)
MMKLTKYNLSGKAALITGASGLLGPMHADALLQCGATLILTDISERALIEIKNSLLFKHPKSQIYIREMNVTLENDIKSSAEFYKNNGLNIDILINNAAINPKFDNKKFGIESSRLEFFSFEEWNRQISVGLTGAFLCCKEFGYQMACSGKGGVIINIASDLSVISPDHRLYEIHGLPEQEQPVKPITYSVIKSGILGLTKYVSTYWADKGVRCNALSPGGVFTNHENEFVTRISRLIPMGRMAMRDEYMGAIQFLCSDASSYMNGQNLIIDGGRTTW